MKDKRIDEVRKMLKDMKEMAKSMPIPTTPEMMEDMKKITNEAQDLISYIEDIIKNNYIKT